MSSQIQITGETKVKSLTGVLVGTSGVVSSLNIDGSLGIPQLDVNGKILVSQLPNSVMEYKGTWDASTNTPTLANGTGNQGDVYLCSVAGTVNFGAGPISFVVSDQVIYSGSIWQKASGTSGTVTSVAASITGNSLGITGSPITTAGTLAFAFAGTNLQYVNGAGNLTTFPTLLSSVGLSMPSAFSVSNSPLTSNGTISVTGAGVASQYIRGDGTLASFPTGGGGGSSVSYYLNGGTNQGTFVGNTYYEMSKNAVIGTGVDFTINANGYISQFITDANDPAQLVIPAGNWNFEMYFSASSGGGSPSFYVELYKYNGSTFTLIADNSANPEYITNGTAIDLYTTSFAVPETSLTITDRLAIRVYVLHASKTITLHTQDSHLCQIITTFSTGITALNGLTAQVQYFATGTSGSDFNISSSTATHTFNIPDASATARGLITTGVQTIAGNKTFSGQNTFGDINKYNVGILMSQSGGGSTSTGYTSFSAYGTNGVAIGTITQSNILTFNSTALRTYTFPDASGTIALVGGSGVGTVTSVAALTLGTTGTDLSSTVANSTTTPVITLNVPTASATNRGALSSADWSTFNSKESALTFSSPLVRTTNTISIPVATTSVNGYLSSTDWTTFNNKLSTSTAASTYVPYTGANANVDLGTYSLTSTGITVKKSSGISTITFPQGFNDPAFIQHEESTTDIGIMRFSVGDNNDTNDYFVFGNTSGTASAFVEKFKITASGIVNLGIWNGSAIADAYISSAATWNAKQNAITLTTTGSSGAATFSANTLNIPDYGSALSGYVPYTGATTDVNLGSRALSAGNILGTTLSASQTSNSQPSLSVTNAGTFRIADFNNSGALVAYITNAGSIYGSSFVKSGGSSSQFLKADGTIDSTSYYSSGGGTITGNVYMQSSGNPSQLLAKGTNTEFWVDSQYGGGTARAFINRNSTGNQSTLMFTTGVAITNGTAWAGSVDWSMGMTNDATNNFYIGYGDIYSAGNRKLTIASTGAATFSGSVSTNTLFKGRVGSSGVGFETTNGVDADFSIETVSGGTTKIGTSGNKLAINSGGGNVLIGTTTDIGAKLYVNGVVGFGTYSSSVKLYTKSDTATSASYALGCENGSVNLFLVRGDGNINLGLAANSPYNSATTGRTAVINSNGDLGYLVSTRESKSNIESIKNVDFINKLNPVQFNYRKKDNLTNEFTDELYDYITYGFIADEVEKVNKELVMYNQDNTLAGVEYNSMIAILTKAIQELNERLIKLESATNP